MMPFKFLRCGTPVAVADQAFDGGTAEHGLQPTAAGETTSAAAEAEASVGQTKEPPTSRCVLFFAHGSS